VQNGQPVISTIGAPMKSPMTQPLPQCATACRGKLAPIDSVTIAVPEAARAVVDVLLRPFLPVKNAGPASKTPG